MPVSAAVNSAPSAVIDVDMLDSVIADLQTELNRIDRRGAQERGVGSMEDLQVLRLLLAQGPLRIGAIAAVRAASKATASARIDRLERKGLVQRSRVDGDRRAVVCELTRAGRKVATASRTRRRDLFAAVAGDVETDSLRTLVDLLRDA